MDTIDDTTKLAQVKTILYDLANPREILQDNIGLTNLALLKCGHTNSQIPDDLYFAALRYHQAIVSWLGWRDPKDILHTVIENRRFK